MCRVLIPTSRARQSSHGGKDLSSLQLRGCGGPKRTESVMNPIVRTSVDHTVFIAGNKVYARPGSRIMNITQNGMQAFGHAANAPQKLEVNSIQQEREVLSRASLTVEFSSAE